MNDPALIRAAALMLPAIAAVTLAFARPPDERRRAALLLGACWNLAALAFVQALNRRAGWWTFDAEGGLFLGMPVDLWLGWSVLWGVLPPLVAPRVPVWLCVVVAAWLDLLLMPAAAPVLRLGERWLHGEAVALLVAFVPGLLLARWTDEDRRLHARAVLQCACFSALTFGLLPAAILQQTSGGWEPLATRSFWAGGLAAQLLAVPGILGLSAVQECAVRGGGTPLPYDPPRRLVTSGPYAYVANPMQLAMCVLLVGWGVLLASPAVAAAGFMAAVYSAGLAAWDEREALGRRFGAPYHTYRAQVRAWWPRWRPVTPPVRARLYVAVECDPCSRLGTWIAARGPVGLDVVAAEDHPSRLLTRVTYDAGDGSAAEEGLAALGRALEHVHLGWALAGFAVRLPLVRPALQVLVDGVGGGPRPAQRPSASRWA